MSWLERAIIGFGYLFLFALFSLIMCEFTVFPMMENYRECGTITLCKNSQQVRQ